MNGPALAAILTLAAILFAIWFAWFGVYQHRPVLIGVTFVGWVIPLFYAGGWAAGASFWETTSTLLFIVFACLLRWIRDSLRSWAVDAALARDQERAERIREFADDEKEADRP